MRGARLPVSSRGLPCLAKSSSSPRAVAKTPLGRPTQMGSYYNNAPRAHTPSHIASGIGKSSIFRAAAVQVRDEIYHGERAVVVLERARHRERARRSDARCGPVDRAKRREATSEDVARARRVDAPGRAARERDARGDRARRSGRRTRARGRGERARDKKCTAASGGGTDARGRGRAGDVANRSASRRARDDVANGERRAGTRGCVRARA